MIKTGDPSTINDLAWLGGEWAQDCAIEDFDADNWLELVRGYSIYVDYCARCLYDERRQPIGFVLGAIVKIPHNHRMTAQIHYMYVQPQALTHAALWELHSEFESWAESFQVQEIAAPDFYSIPDAYLEFFKEIGYESGYVTYNKGI